MKKISWNPEKSLTIEKNPNRGVSFANLAELIETGWVLEILKRPGYPDQNVFALAVDHQVWAVPFRETEDEIFLITAWPDRKLTKRLLK